MNPLFRSSPLLMRPLVLSRICLKPKSTNSSSEETFRERNFQEVRVDIFGDLITNEDVKKRIEMIINEYEYEKYTTLRVPDSLTKDNMKDLLSVTEANDRKKMFNFLYIKQNQRLKSLNKRKEISEKYRNQQKEKFAERNCNRTGIWDNDHNLVYGLWHNTLVSKIPSKSLSILHNHRLRSAALFGQKVVIDLSYDKYMKLHENRLLLKQLNLLYNFNKYKAKDPFDLHFTDCDPNSVVMKEMHRFFPNFESPRFMASIHKKSFLDLFPKQNLVYLSPHADKSLEEVNEDMILVIGGLIDKSFDQPITYIKAQKAGVQSFRLPIDENILWRSGSKALCLNHILAILHDFKETGDWRRALQQNIPQRKQKTAEQIELEDSLRKLKYYRQNKKFNQKYSQNSF